MESKWKILKTIVSEAADDARGKKEQEERVEWFDEECLTAIRERNEARKRMLQRRTRLTMEEYREKRKSADKICRYKKRAYERKRIEELDEMKDRNEVRKFYERTRDLKRGFQPRAVFFKDKNGNFVSDKNKILKRWQEYFYELLNKNNEDYREDGNREEREFNEEPVEQPDLEEVKIAIKALKNNKAPGEDGMESELLKYVGEGIEKAVHELINEVWIKEEMPKDWTVGIIYPIHKKGDKAVCGNYRGITLLDGTYKVFGKILASRLELWMERILGDYQAGFRKIVLPWIKFLY